MRFYLGKKKITFQTYTLLILFKSSKAIFNGLVVKNVKKVDLLIHMSYFIYKNHFVSVCVCAVCGRIVEFVFHNSLQHQDERKIFIYKVTGV